MTTETPSQQPAAAGGDAIVMMEQSYLRVPWEQIRRSFRHELKIAEKDLGPVVSALKALRVSDGEKLAKVRGRLVPLLAKLMTAHENSSKFSQRFEKRILETEAMMEKQEGGNGLAPAGANLELCRWHKSRMSRIIVEFLLRNGYNRAAELLLASGDPDSADTEVYDERNRIRDAILDNKSATDCLAWCSDNRAALKKRGSLLEFMLRRQEFIELARQRDLRGAIAYARKHFPAFTESNDLDIEQALALLAVPPETSVMPYSWLYSEERWQDIADQFECESQDLHGLCDRPQLASLIRVGLSALKTPLCGDPESTTRQLNCPVCSPPLSGLASSVPFSHHETSSLVCYISGEPMDADNPPMVLPNGFVYSRKSLDMMAAQMDNNITCPRSRENFKIEQARKCFIS